MGDLGDVGINADTLVDLDATECKVEGGLAIGETPLEGEGDSLGGDRVRATDAANDGSDPAMWQRRLYGLLGVV